MTAPSSPPRVRLRLRSRTKPSPPEIPWRLAAGVAAAAVLAASAGDGFVAAALLGLAAGPWAAVGAVLAMAATVARWGTADLAAVAGDQDVLGAAATSGPTLMVVSSALAAGALLLVVPSAGVGGERRLALVVAGGVGAAALAFGPAPTTGRDLVLRAGASVGGAVVALVLSSAPVRRRLPAWSTAVLGVSALACAIR